MSTPKYQFFICSLIVLTAAFSCYSFDTKTVADEKRQSDSKGFAVVELFTSEGCSSCPAADELVRKVLSENHPNVYVVSFHVDYWNRLGWKDEFSQAAFSDRQKQYARHLSAEGIYTPQIVVNGLDGFVGSNEAKLRNSLNSAKEESQLTIEASKTDNSTVHISYAIAGNNSDLLNVALVQSEAATEVKAGENSGRELHHVNIVREFTTVETTGDKGTVNMQIPTKLLSLPFKVIAYTQQKSDFKINGAAQAQIEAGKGSGTN